MKLFVQIPCFNEEDTLAQTVRDIPREIDGISDVYVLIIDDGSTDKTIEVAKECGVDFIVRNKTNKGLAHTFSKGLAACLSLGADIIVNTDGDNQYQGEYIKSLVAPIIAGNADIVIGDRQTDSITHFSPTKRFFQKFGSWVVRKLSNLIVNDAVSGFRAYSRTAAMQTNVLSDFSYTVETIIQAGVSGLTVESVPVKTNPATRDSRLFVSIPSFMKKQGVTLIRSYTMYKPLNFYSLLGILMLVLGLVPMVRFLFYTLIGQGGGMIQSLILGSVLLLSGFMTLVLALLADSVSMNRKLIEKVLISNKRIEDELSASRGKHTDLGLDILATSNAANQNDK